MNNSTAASIAETQSLIQEIQDETVLSYAIISTLTLLVYSTLLQLDAEVQYMWGKRFTIPSVLYFFNRYAAIFFVSTSIVTTFLPATAPLSTCNSLATLGNCAALFAYFGLQGLLIARGYSLSKGNIFVATALGLLYLTGLALSIYESAAFPGCIATETNVLQRVNFTQGILVIATDTLVFLVTIVNLGTTFRQGLRIKAFSSDNLIPLLVRQGILRYLFVMVVTITNTVLLSIGSLSVELADAFTYLQEGVSVIIISEFFLNLRQQNEQQIDNAQIQSLSWSVAGAQNALHRVHDTIINELGEFPESESRSPDVETPEA